jgi:hypothetical protein
MKNAINIQIIISLYILVLKNCTVPGTCGSVKTLPKDVSDCVKYSTTSEFCCFLNATNAVALYSNCISMKNE